MATDLPAGAPPALAVHNIQIVYGGAIEAVRDVSLEVRPGQIVALLGSNGAGKSSVLKAVSGVLDAEDGVIEKGSIRLGGEPIDRVSKGLLLGGHIEGHGGISARAARKSAGAVRR